MANMSQFSPKQLKAIELLANPSTEMTKEEIAEQCGVNTATLWRWRRNPKFQQAVNDLAYDILKDELPKVYNSMAKKAIKGNPKCIEMMLKFAGNFVEKTETTVNGSMDLGGMSDEEIDKLVNEQERLRKLAEGEK